MDLSNWTSFCDRSKARLAWDSRNSPCCVAVWLSSNCLVKLASFDSSLANNLPLASMDVSTSPNVVFNSCSRSDRSAWFVEIKSASFSKSSRRTFVNWRSCSALLKEFTYSIARCWANAASCFMESILDSSFLNASEVESTTRLWAFASAVFPSSVLVSSWASFLDCSISSWSDSMDWFAWRHWFCRLTNRSFRISRFFSISLTCSCNTLAEDCLAFNALDALSKDWFSTSMLFLSFAMDAKAALEASSFEARSVTKASIDCWIKNHSTRCRSVETSW